MSETISSPTFTFRKAGVFYFSRRVPSALRSHYSASRICYSLRTRSERVAEARARKAADQLDQYWYHLRTQLMPLPGAHLLRSGGDTTAAPPRQDVESEAQDVCLSEAVALYIKLKGAGRPDTFKRAAERSCGYVIDVCGDLPIDAYSKADANRFRDALVERKLAGSSITRVLGTVRSVTNFAASELGLDYRNPFTRIYYDREAGVAERAPVSTKELALVQAKCRDVDDELRWLVALVSDTGMRLAEAAGLLKEDICRSEDGELVARVRPHPWRRLKTKGSERDVPLVGAAAWAAERVLASSIDSVYAFPRYNSGETTNANSASAALNKWMKDYTPKGTTMHGFRHAMRDRLRAVECPADIVDQIGGWQTDGVGHAYGRGYPTEVLRKWLKAVT
ncbi:DUF6538 domain-containing protein [Pseudooceanicola marinus]|uniref:DUF6538 domain-containing protein n=1 Tax=Pseudooceanicola marinus TaxID=396013 RepID=UPI001CD44B5E|nr:DUF6538 domain-containing protein [Pseudooceanicola marinus]MCA1338083.1 tyrosine-type recombinase/integrase [Pseudooceanicola marinus]